MRSSSATLASFTRGRPCGSPADAFVLVDQLPVVVGDQLRLALQQPLGQRLGVVGAKSASSRAAQVREQGVDGVLGVLLVGADHAGRSALDPADHVLVAAALDPAVGVRDGAAPLVERQPRRRHAAVADRPDHQLRRQLLALAGVLGRHPAVVVRPARCGPARSTRLVPSPLISIGEVRNRNTMRRLAPRGVAFGVPAQHLDVVA